MAEKMLESTWIVTINSCGKFSRPRYTVVNPTIKVSTGETTNPLVLAEFQGARYGASKKRVLFYGSVSSNVSQAHYPD